MCKINCFPEDVEALVESIHNWEARANGTPVSYECALCKLDDSRERQNKNYRDCEQCIILADTGTHGCNNTPYGDWANAVGKDQKREKAQVMVNYLHDLWQKLIVTED